MLEANHFGVVDYLVVAGTLLFSLFIGVFYACKGNQTNEELLVGGRKMSILPITCSLLVTYLSAITVLGYPAEIYSHGTQIFMMPITSIFFIPLGTYLFVYVFYSMRVTSVYEYLEYRFETVMVRWLASITFIFQVEILNGVVLYAPSIALQAILGLPVWMSVVGIGVCGTVYTSIGGIKAVVWTDVFQFFMMLIGMLSIVIKGLSKAGGIYEALEKTDKHGRLELFDFTIDPFMRHNALNFFLGYGFNVIVMYGTHQPQVQRYCSLPTFKHAVKSILLSIILNFLTMTLVLATGIAIFATYAGCDPVLLGDIGRSDQIVPHFVINELANIPEFVWVSFANDVYGRQISKVWLWVANAWVGQVRVANVLQPFNEIVSIGMMGLFVSCIFSAVLSSLSSILNSLSAVTWQDFLSRIPYFQRMTDVGQANTSKLLAGFYGILTIFFAFAAQYMGPVLQATLTSFGAISGPLGAVFFVGLFMPCVNKWGALFGMLGGLSTMMYIGISSLGLSRPHNIPLPTNVDECPAGTNLTKALLHTPKVLEEFEWPEKLFTLSYMMYPFVGACLTVFLSLLISALTGGFCSAHKVKRKYLHPLLRGRFGAPDEEDRPQTTGIKCHADRTKDAHDYVKDTNSSGKKSALPFKNYNYESIPTLPEADV